MRLPIAGASEQAEIAAPIEEHVRPDRREPRPFRALPWHRLTGMGMRVSIDYDKCTGVAACEAVCPEVFVIRESDGLADVLEPEPHETLWECVRRAEEACPEEAIVIEKDDD